MTITQMGITKVEESDQDAATPIKSAIEMLNNGLEPIMPTKKELDRWIDATEKSELDPIDQLAEGLTLLQLDRVARFLRERETASNLLCQLSTITNIITTLGALMGVELDDGPVEPSHNFAKWTAQKLSLVAIHIKASCESLIRERESAMQESTEAGRVMVEAETQLGALAKKSTEISSVSEAKINIMQQSIVRLNRILTSYTDVEDYVVSKVDPVTGKPVRFYVEGDDAIKSTKYLSNADHLSLREARDLRSRIISSVRSRMPRAEQVQVDDTVAVMQIALNRVNLIGDDDETD